MKCLEIIKISRPLAAEYESADENIALDDRPSQPAIKYRVPNIEYPNPVDNRHTQPNQIPQNYNQPSPKVENQTAYSQTS